MSLPGVRRSLCLILLSQATSSSGSSSGLGDEILTACSHKLLYFICRRALEFAKWELLAFPLTIACSL